MKSNKGIITINSLFSFPIDVKTDNKQIGDILKMFKNFSNSNNNRRILKDYKTIESIKVITTKQTAKLKFNNIRDLVKFNVELVYLYLSSMNLKTLKDARTKVANQILLEFLENEENKKNIN